MTHVTKCIQFYGFNKYIKKILLEKIMCPLATHYNCFFFCAFKF